MVLSFTPRRIEAVDTVAVIHLPICNKWEQSPEIREGTQLDLPDITENKITPRRMKGFIVG
jgi:hypothetical protein